MSNDQSGPAAMQRLLILQSLFLLASLAVAPAALPTVNFETRSARSGRWSDADTYRFEIAKPSNYDPTLNLRQPDGARRETDVRTIPFLRFEDNESHSEGLYSFNFGDDRNGSVRGDRQHPFIARNSWEPRWRGRLGNHPRTSA